MTATDIPAILSPVGKSSGGVVAGVLADFVYTADSGTKYRYRGDKSNNLAIGNVAYDVETDGALPYLPKNMAPRYVLFESQNPVAGRAPLQRKIPAGSPDNAYFLSETNTVTLDVVGAVAGAVFKLTFTKSQEMRRIKDLD